MDRTKDFHLPSQDAHFSLPCVKGGGARYACRRDCKSKNVLQNNPSPPCGGAPFTQGSLSHKFSCGGIFLTQGSLQNNQLSEFTLFPSHPFARELSRRESLLEARHLTKSLALWERWRSSRRSGRIDGSRPRCCASPCGFDSGLRPPLRVTQKRNPLCHFVCSRTFPPVSF